MDKSIKVSFYNHLFHELTLGILCGFNAIVNCLAYGALFAAISIEYVSILSGYYLFGAVVVMALSALFSSIPFVIAMPQNHAAPLILAIAFHITGFSSILPAQIFPTLFVAVVLTTLLTGIANLGLGVLHRGDLIRFMPYPVIAGFLAGLGGVMLTRSVLAMGSTNSIIELISNLDARLASQELAALAFASIAIILHIFFKKPYTISLLFICAVFFFHILLFLTNTPLSIALREGWVISLPSQDYFWHLPKIKKLIDINWFAIIDCKFLILAVAVTNTIALLMNAASLEISTKSNINLDRELEVSGVANIVGSLGGGIAGFIAIGQTQLVMALKGKTRLIGLVGAACCAIALYFGATLLAFIPKFALFGTLIFLSLIFLNSWLISVYKKVSTREYLLILAIFCSVLIFGFITGIVLGMIFSLFMFVLDYRRTNPIRYSLTEKKIHSNKIRSPRAQNYLQQNGDQVVYFQLGGFLFFGSAYSLISEILEYTQKHKKDVHYVVLDFYKVIGIDSSSIQYLLRLKQHAQDASFCILLSGVSPKILQAMNKEKLISGPVRLFKIMGDALEWCEEEILKDYESGEMTKLVPRSFLQQLMVFMGNDIKAQQLEKYFERREADADTLLFKQGDVSDGIYFLERGEVIVIFENHKGEQIVLRKLCAENLIGEMGFYTNGLRGASVWTKEPCILRFLSAHNLDEIQAKEPGLFIALQKRIIKIVAQRLNFRNQLDEVIVPSRSTH